MELIEPSDEMLIININKRTHKMEIQDETESSLSIVISPITPLPQRPETDKED